MRKRINNRINMIGVTIDYCEKNSSAWSGISAFGGVLNKIKQKKAQAEAFNEVADTPTKGLTADVREQRKKMTQLAIRCGSATLAYANEVNDHKLAAEVNF